MKRWISLLLTLLLCILPIAQAENDQEEPAQEAEAQSEGKSIGESVGDFFVDAGDTISDAAIVAGDAISGAAVSAGDAISDAAGSAGAAISGAWSRLTGGGEPTPTPEPTPEPTPLPTPNPDTKHWFFETVIRTDTDKGYAGTKKIDVSDPHFGWRLGRFDIDGFTEYNLDENGNPVFIKMVGDQIALRFLLEQDIACLDGRTNVVIEEDKNGYDQYFGVKKTNFGRGTLITRQISHENYTYDPQVYTDYLAGVAADAETSIKLFEEGDYEVALDYEIRSPGALGIAVYTDYRMTFRFSVRNGNSMDFLFDLGTGAEIGNDSYTENGFRIDLARSKYLKVNVERRSLTVRDGRVVEDTRMNGAAQDGKEYMTPGVYIITVTNTYSGAVTEKRVFVGPDDLIRAYYEAGGPSIDEFNRLYMSEEGDAQ